MKKKEKILNNRRKKLKKERRSMWKGKLIEVRGMSFVQSL